MDTFGGLIRETRKKRGLSMIELGEKLNISQGYLSKIENNKKIPNIKVIKRLSEVLNIPFFELMAKAGYIIPYSSSASINIEDLKIEREKIYSFAEIIKNSRNLKQISLEELSMKTKIPLQSLIKLEENNVNHLNNEDLLKLAEFFDYPFIYFYFLLKNDFHIIFNPDSITRKFGIRNIRFHIHQLSEVLKKYRKMIPDIDNTDNDISSKIKIRYQENLSLYKELKKILDIDNCFRLLIFSDVESNKFDLNKMLQLTQIPIYSNGRELSINDRSLILKTIENLENKLEFKE
ncbi:helix-turn-helix domain-containing protein [Calidifontibacillus erzurumensis]|uniref:Helix-turn-helix domain-containing protein n=1 Tax=Calidifontibacillus erzurumensis TaxID=2741433 RepID=A0A8J8GJ45_9BACI|nr:helix-turn-helix domain-containing protein [Calidifontibacillus erzurumensis]NSL53298.1 helix-turn-helix domain-containing protein [Calidifontibacillus erzurumensis]